MEALLDANGKEEEDEGDPEILRYSNHHFDISKLPRTEHVKT